MMVSLRDEILSPLNRRTTGKGAIKYQYKNLHQLKQFRWKDPKDVRLAIGYATYLLSGIPDMQKPRLIGRGFCNKKRGEEKMKKRK